MSDPIHAAVNWDVVQVVTRFLLPVGGVMVLGTLAFGLLERRRPQRKRTYRRRY